MKIHTHRHHASFIGAPPSAHTWKERLKCAHKADTHARRPHKAKCTQKVWLSGVIMSRGDWSDETSAVGPAASRWHNTEQSTEPDRTQASAHHTNVDLTCLTRTMQRQSSTTMSRHVQNRSVRERRGFSFFFPVVALCLRPACEKSRLLALC